MEQDLRCDSHLPYLGLQEGKFSKEGDEILGVSNEGFALADPRRVHRRRLLVEGPPSDSEGKHSRNFRRFLPREQDPISDYNELFVMESGLPQTTGSFPPDRRRVAHRSQDALRLTIRGVVAQRAGR